MEKNSVNVEMSGIATFLRCLNHIMKTIEHQGREISELRKELNKQDGRDQGTCYIHTPLMTDEYISKPRCADIIKFKRPASDRRKS